MGVTLERVQFRFASIIGELCNEPQVLSQFAVWLDMRLAEFKLKGSISLDCSGEPAPPGWMDGLEDAIIKRASCRRKSKQGRSGTNDDEGEITIMEDRKSDLATDYIANNNYSSENNRKRTFETWHCEEPESASPKMLRFSKSGNGESIHNQNLLSVISIEHSSPSEEDKSQIHSDSRADYSSEQIHSGADYSSELIHSGADYSGDQTHSQIDLSESQDFTSQETDLSRYFSPAQSSSMPEPSSFNRSLPQQSSMLGGAMTTGYRGGVQIDVIKHNKIIKWVSDTFTVQPGKRILSQTVFEMAAKHFVVPKVLIGRVMKYLFPKGGIKTQSSSGKTFYYNLGLKDSE